MICLNRSSRPKMFCKKGVLKNFAKFTGKYLYQSLFLINFGQVFSCEFWEIFKNTSGVFVENLRWLLLLKFACIRNEIWRRSFCKNHIIIEKERLQESSRLLFLWFLIDLNCFLILINHKKIPSHGRYTQKQSPSGVL